MKEERRALLVIEWLRNKKLIKRAIELIIKMIRDGFIEIIDLMIKAIPWVPPVTS